MSLQMDIKGKIKEAMMAKDTVRLDVLRGMSAAFTNELVAKGRKPQDELTDDEVMAVIMRLSKQRKDSIEQFEKANRPELVAEEKAQLTIIEEFLPKFMSAEEIRPIAEAKKAELGVADKSGAGKLTGVLMKDLKGKADGTTVKQVVDSLFA
jgi:uncharacterized protein YqeY